MSQETLVEMADMLEAALAAEHATPDVARKIFKIFVESSQNILKYSHRREKLGGKMVGAGLISVLKWGNHFCTQTGNYVSREQAKTIDTTLTRISGMNTAQLKEYYREHLRKGTRLEEGESAGLGLVQMARVAGEPLKWDFLEIYDNLMYYTLQVTVHAEGT